MSAQGLFDAIGLAPSLPGARCRGRHRLFDEAQPGEDADYRHSQALALCGTCPALTRCEQWFDDLPRSRRPAGVVAGQLNRPKAVGRPRRSA